MPSREEIEERIAEKLFPAHAEHPLEPAPPLAHIENLNVNENTREMFVSGEIEDDFGAWFTRALRYLLAQSHAPITVWLNTPGGDTLSAFTFHDLVRASPAPITVIATGQVCSAGVLMLACAHQRLVTEACALMVHQGSGEMDGRFGELEAGMKFYKWVENHWAMLMARYATGESRTEAYWLQLCKKNAEWWALGGAAIVAAGLADGVYNGRG